MSGVLKSDLETYFRDARTFDGERAMAAARSRKRAWLIASGSAAIAMASVLAVVGMLPLRTVEVHVFRVDSATGVVDLVAPLRGTQTYNDAIAKYFLAKYVRGREGYLADEARTAFHVVSLMSSEDEQRRFADAVTPRNPKAFASVLGQHGRADVAVKSITFPHAAREGSPSKLVRLALVRFARTVTYEGGRIETSTWVATLSFTFVAGEMSETDRAFNPLGFVVSQYRLDPEAL